MADLQIGNIHEVAARGGTDRALLATVTADGVNTVTVNTPANIPVGIAIDIVDKTTGVVLASNRTVTSITSAGVVTYSGGDVTATTSHGIYPTGYGPTSQPNKVNTNGGYADNSGLNMENADTILAARTRLAAINGTYYTAAVLNMMTYNDMLYAIRLNDFVGSMN